MRFLAVRGNPNLATPAKRHTGARHRAARAPHSTHPERSHDSARPELRRARNDLRPGVRKKQLSAIYRAKTKRTQEHLCSVALWNTL